MNQKDCVSLFVDIFKWGVLILTLTIGWLLPNSDLLDWPSAEHPDAHESVRIAFLGFSAVFWFGWALVLDRIRERSVRQPDASDDFLGETGLAHANWAFCLLALGIAWYAVFDDQPAILPSVIAGVALFASPVATLWRKFLHARGRERIQLSG
jgi:hypothetical protein